MPDAPRPRAVISGNVRQLPPPAAKQVEDTLAGKLGEDGKVLHLLIKAREAQGFWRGAVLGGLIMLLVGAAGTLAVTTSLFDPIAKVTFTNGVAKHMIETQAQ